MNTARVGGPRFKERPGRTRNILRDAVIVFLKCGHVPLRLVGKPVTRRIRPLALAVLSGLLVCGSGVFMFGLTASHEQSLLPWPVSFNIGRRFEARFSSDSYDSVRRQVRPLRGLAP